MQAIVLVGGFGTRLQEVVSDVPKPMAPIGSKPFLAILLENIKSYGVREVVLSVHYKREIIQDYFKDKYKNIKIKYAIEENPLGTGGAIANSLEVLHPNKPVIVFNGDTFVKADYAKMYEEHSESGAELTIALRRVSDCKRYGQVMVNNNKIITDFSHAGSNEEGYINAGIYVINPKLFEKFRLNKSFSFERDFLYQYTPQLKPRAFYTDDYFIDIGVPEDYQRAVNELPKIVSEL